MSMLLAFQATARTGSFTNAAEELSLTQSAISRQVQLLEQMLGANLFDRSSRNIKLTPQGAMFYADIKVAIEQIRRASAKIYNSKNESNSLHIAVLPMFASKWLMPRLGSYQGKHPEAKITLTSRSSAFHLLDSSVDAFITLDSEKPRDFVCQNILTANAVVIASPTLLKNKRLSNITDLYEHHLLETTSLYPSWREACLENNVDISRLKFGHKYEYTAHLIQAVIDGLGIAIVSDIFIEEELKNSLLSVAQIDSFSLRPKTYSAFHPQSIEANSSLHYFISWLLAQSTLDNSSK